MASALSVCVSLDQVHHSLLQQSESESVGSHVAVDAQTLHDSVPLCDFFSMLKLRLIIVLTFASVSQMKLSD